VAEEYYPEDETTDLQRFSRRVNYNFESHSYDIDTFRPEKNEPDNELAVELKKYYPELRLWPVRALATAWRLYSKDVGFVEEELVCVRSPNLLGYLFVRQENWPVPDKDWLSAIDAAIRILWPTDADNQSPP
jgi:hypothetical protein